MKTVLVEKYGVDQDNPENRVVTEMWDFLQTQVCDVRTSVCIHIQLIWFRSFGPFTSPCAAVYLWKPNDPISEKITKNNTPIEMHLQIRLLFYINQNHGKLLNSLNSGRIRKHDESAFNVTTHQIQSLFYQIWNSVFLLLWCNSSRQIKISIIPSCINTKKKEKISMTVCMIEGCNEQAQSPQHAIYSDLLSQK